MMPPNRLKLFGTSSLPPGIPLRHPIFTVSTSLREAAKTLKVTHYHLSKQPMPTLSKTDRERAFANPGQRFVAEDVIIRD